MSFLKLLILAQTTLMLMEMKWKTLHFTFKKWPAGQLCRWIIFLCMGKLPAWQSILQLTREISMPHWLCILGWLGNLCPAQKKIRLFLTGILEWPKDTYYYSVKGCRRERTSMANHFGIKKQWESKNETVKAKQRAFVFF